MKLRFLVILAAVFALSGEGRAQTVSPILIQNGVVTGNCVPVGNPYIESPCIAGIMKIIARSTSAESLTDWIRPETCWGYLVTPPYNESNIPPPTTPVNCIKPYDRCQTRYCPDKYSQIIKTLTEIKASLIVRAANCYGKDDVMKPGTDYYNSLRQIVIDINAAYDCAGLQRPVIQGGGAIEHIGPAVNSVPIPVSIINAFKFDPGFENYYYLNPNGTPKTNLKFSFQRIHYTPPAPGYEGAPDITKIEARMWFYYISTIFIDLGYKSIHLGQLAVWGKIDKTFFNLVSTTSLLNKIRSYAQSHNTFVFLTEENYKALKFPGTNTFMFDYDSRAIRPREVSNPQVCGDFGCYNPL